MTTSKKEVKKDIKKRVPYSELSDEKKTAIKEKQAARAEEEGREESGNAFFQGTLISRGRSYGWIEPSNPGKLPAAVKKAMKEMTAEKKAKAVENGRDDAFEKDVLYVRMCDVVEGVKLDKDMKVKFKVYTDSKGVGCHEVSEA